MNSKLLEQAVNTYLLNWNELIETGVPFFKEFNLQIIVKGLSS